MKHPRALHRYQRAAVQFLLDRSRAALLLDMGLGKTVTVLTALRVLFDHGRCRGALVLAPRRVVENTWKQEAALWSHTAGLRVSILRGNKATKTRELLQEHHIHVINYESIPWLATQLNALFLGRGRPLPWDTLILDEMSRVKNPAGVRVRYLQPMLPHFERRYGLTGTPAPNGYLDLFGQYMCLTDGRTLGDSLTEYKERYFYEDPYARTCEPTAEGKETIERLVSEVSLSMKAADYIELPDIVYDDVTVELPPKARAQYDKFEKELFLQLDATQIEVFNAATLTTKCRQLANGTVLDTETQIAHPVHDAKLDALESILEEAGGSPILCAYIFRADLERIRARFATRYRTAYLGPGVGMKQGQDIVSAWNRQEYHLLLAHPQSIGHGLNLQAGGHQIAWFGLDWALEGWLQFNARLHRQGQGAPVMVYRIVARRTVDEAVRDALDRKARGQEGLRRAIETYRHERAQSGL